MRLDLLLKQSGLIKRRTIAQQFCERGLVSVNGKVCKPSYKVKEGDVLELTYGEKVIVFTIHIENNGKKQIIHLTANEIKEENKNDA